MLSSFICCSQLPVGVLIQLVGKECIPKLLSDDYDLPWTSKYLEDLFSSAIVGMAGLNSFSCSFDVALIHFWLYPTCVYTCVVVHKF